MATFFPSQRFSGHTTGFMGRMKASQQAPPQAPSPSTSPAPPPAPPQYRAPPMQLPDGWVEHWSQRKQAPYYESVKGEVTWVRPTVPAYLPTPPPPRAPPAQPAQLSPKERARAMFTSMGFPITEESTSADLTKAFRTLALKYHPDKGGDPAVFQSISNARDVLMGAGRKRKHTRKAKKTKKSKKSKKTSKRR